MGLYFKGTSAINRVTAIIKTYSVEQAL